MCFKIKHSYGINWKSWLSWMRGCERWGGNNTVSTCLWDVTHGSPCVGWPCLSLASTLDVCILALHHGLNAIGTIGPGILKTKFIIMHRCGRAFRHAHTIQLCRCVNGKCTWRLGVCTYKHVLSLLFEDQSTPRLSGVLWNDALSHVESRLLSRIIDYKDPHPFPCIRR